MNLIPALSRIRVVLSRPSHPGNIGAAARAMKTMGLERLVLVEPRAFPHPEADARASGARDVLERAVLYSSLEQALAGTVAAAAFTTRPRDLAHPRCTVREAARQLLTESACGDVALVFGTEASGLSAAELSLCRITAFIPANPAYPSLNLAAAVQIAAYEARLAEEILPPAQDRPPPAVAEDVELFFRHLEAVMISSGFLNPAQPKRLMRRLRRLFARARLEKEEVAILRGILNAVDDT